MFFINQSTDVGNRTLLLRSAVEIEASGRSFPNMSSAWWRHQMKAFPRYWPFVQGIRRSTVNSPHIGHWHGALVFSLICAWINGSVNNREAGVLRRHRTHYNVTVMGWWLCCLSSRSGDRKSLLAKAIFNWERVNNSNLRRARMITFYYVEIEYWTQFISQQLYIYICDLLIVTICHCSTLWSRYPLQFPRGIHVSNSSNRET